MISRLLNKMNIFSNFTVNNFVYNFRFYKNFRCKGDYDYADYIAAHKQLNCIDPKK